MGQEMWEEASADFIELAELSPKSYLAPVSLFNGASCQEEAGNSEVAAELYARLFEGYKDTAPVAVEALFNMGRIAEETGDRDKALEYYETLVSDYENTDWKNVAKTRILLMN